MSSFLYILEGHEPISCPDVLEWARWFEEADELRRVALDRVGSHEVSTVFLGLDYRAWPDKRPLLFETMVFSAAGRPEEMRRYSTWDEAEVGHAMMVAMLRAVEEAR